MVEKMCYTGVPMGNARDLGCASDLDFFCNSVCPNCAAENIPTQRCLHGEIVDDEFKEGLGVMFTIDEYNICSAIVTQDGRGGKNMKLGGANNHSTEENLYL